MDHPGSGLLAGIRVLEVGGGISAPFCAKLLADYGADVVKIEPPSSGDPVRGAGPFAGDDPHLEKSIPFLYLNTNKRGISLDVTSTSGRRAFHALLRTADVLVESCAPAEAEALGRAMRRLAASIRPWSTLPLLHSASRGPTGTSK